MRRRHVTRLLAALPALPAAALGQAGGAARAIPPGSPPCTAELLAHKVSVLYGDGPGPLRVSQAATRTVPIVAIDFEDDPVAAGYARSIARPGGNVTGEFLDLPDFTVIGSLREGVPRASRLALMWDPTTGPTQLGGAHKDR